MSNNNENQTSNKKKLTLSELILMGVSGIVGAGLFFIIGKSTKYGGNKTMIALLVAAFISLVMGGCYIELYSRFKSSITEYLALRDTMGEFSGQLMIFLTYMIAIFTTVTVVIAISKYITSFSYLACYKNSMFFQKSVSIFILCAISIINYFGIEMSAVVAKTIAILMFIIVGGAILLSGKYISLAEVHNAPEVNLDSFTLSAILSLFLFNGYDFLVKMSDDSANPENIKTSIIATLTITTFIYFAIMCSSICVLGYTASSKTHNVITDMYSILTNNHISHVVYVIGAFMMFNTALLTLLAATRFINRLGETNIIPYAKFLSQQNSFNAPVNVIYISLVITILLSLVHNVVVMTVFSNVACVLILFLLSVSLLILRFRDMYDEKSQLEHNYIKGNVNNIPVIVVINICLLSYIFYVMVKQKFWIGQV